MFQKERFEQIYSILQERQSATVQYLEKSLFVSKATINRDLKAMEDAGLVKRVWGGVMLETTVDKNPPIFVRAKENSNAKEKIGEIASCFVRESSAIFLDGSTTIMNMIPFLTKFKHLRVVTFGLQTQRELSEKTSIPVHLLGGQVYENYLVTGHMAIANVRQYYADTLFFSCSGISAEYGVTCVDERVVELCQAMMLRAKRRILMCDTSKASRSLMWNIASLDDLDYVIMDSVPNDPALVAALGSKLITSLDQVPQMNP